MRQTASAVPVDPPSNLASWASLGNTGSSAQDGGIGLSPLGNLNYGYVSTFGSEVMNVSPLHLDPNSRGGGTEWNGSKIVSGSFSANLNDTLSIYFNYVSTDGKGYDDYAWARLLNAADNSLVSWLFTAESTNSGSRNIVPGDVVDKNVFDVRTVIVNYDAFAFNSFKNNWPPLGSSSGACWKTDAEGCGNNKVEIGVTNWGDNLYDSGLAFDFQTLTPVPEAQIDSMMLAGLGPLGWIGRRRMMTAVAAA